jgi:hypothetical protein
LINNKDTKKNCINPDYPPKSKNPAGTLAHGRIKLIKKRVD